MVTGDVQLHGRLLKQECTVQFFDGSDATVFSDTLAARISPASLAFAWTEAMPERFAILGDRAPRHRARLRRDRISAMRLSDSGLSGSSSRDQLADLGADRRGRTRCRRCAATWLEKK